MRSIEDPHGPVAGEVSGLPAGSPYRDALADLRPRLIKRLDPHAAWLQSDPLLHRLLGEVQVHSMIVVPLHARGLVLGLACFYRWRSPDAYADDDRVLAQQLATRTALCLDNARLYSHGRAAALILQMRHRPAGTPVHSAVESAYSYPAPAPAAAGPMSSRCPAPASRWWPATSRATASPPSPPWANCGPPSEPWL